MTTDERDVTLYELAREAEEVRERVACVASDLRALAAHMRNGNASPEFAVLFIEEQAHILDGTS